MAVLWRMSGGVVVWTFRLKEMCVILVFRLCCLRCPCACPLFCCTPIWQAWWCSKIQNNVFSYVPPPGGALAPINQPPIWKLPSFLLGVPWVVPHPSGRPPRRPLPLCASPLTPPLEPPVPLGITAGILPMPHSFRPPRVSSRAPRAPLRSD